MRMFLPDHIAELAQHTQLPGLLLALGLEPVACSGEDSPVQHHVDLVEEVERGVRGKGDLGQPEVLSGAWKTG